MNNDFFADVDLSPLGETGRVVVGFSGGADSMALVHYLACHIEKSRLLCAHVNHMLRGTEADRDEAAAKAFCETQGLRFASKRIDIHAEAVKRSMGTEECGREMRYAFFSSLIKEETGMITTAHNADDNAETILMNLAKGTGLQGLCGIPALRGNIFRPLLSVSRAEIEAYCTAFSLPYVTDSSNAGDDYTRNKIRHHVMPVLKEVNPRFVQAAAQMAGILKPEVSYMEKQAKALLEKARTKYGLDIGKLIEADEAVLSLALKLYLEKTGCPRIGHGHIRTVMENLTKEKTAGIPGGLQVSCSRGILRVTATERQPWQLEIHGEKTLLPDGRTLVLRYETLPDTEKIIKINNLLFKSALDYDTITKVLIARNRRHGDKFAPAGRGVTKRLKTLFAEMQVPVPMRDELVFLECGGILAYIEGAGVSERFKVTRKTKNMVFVEIHD